MQFLGRGSTLCQPSRRVDGGGSASPKELMLCPLACQTEAGGWETRGSTDYSEGFPSCCTVLPFKGEAAGLTVLNTMYATAPVFTHGWAQPMLKLPGVRLLPFSSRSAMGATSAEHAEQVRATRR